MTVRKAVGAVGRTAVRHARDPKKTAVKTKKLKGKKVEKTHSSTGHGVMKGRAAAARAKHHVHVPD
jgi:hypothetical protein